MSENTTVFVIDPPWPKKKGGIRAARPKQGRELDYKTMAVPEIFSLLDDFVLPKNEIPHIVFLWCIDAFLRSAEDEMSRRGYKLHARLVWDKGNGVAPAFTVRYSHEYLLWYYKPSLLKVAHAQRGKFTTVIRSPGRQHSRKPDAAYEMVAALYPEEPKIDVFSREPRSGWQQFGNEVNKFVVPKATEERT